MIGTALNQYQITAALGVGGMGEVFRARDTRLNRDVAIKVLPKDFVVDANRLRRFEQESKTLAALNHPNILTIHDAGVHEGAPYLVSELLEGKTLREELHGGALPPRKATDYALQIAHGLAAAHGRGIIHRDLKPENIFVTKDARVKILDFGLAKLGFASQISNLKSHLDPAAPTLVDSTEPGRVLGTPAYMAPEQVRGEVVDHRADIFAFGCVLYEMLSGTRAFRRNTAIDTMAAIMNDGPPDLTVVQPDLPAPLARIVHRCLEKPAERRFQSAIDLAFALENTACGPTPLLPATRVKPTAPVTIRSLLPWGVATLACLVLGIALVMWPGGKSVEAPGSVKSERVSRKFEFSLPAKNTPGHVTFYPAISPDGRKLAYANSSGLWVHSLDRITPPAQLAATTNASNPFWSPDSTDIGYLEGRKVHRVSVQGGTPVLVGTAPREVSEGAGGGAWLTNGRIIFANGWGGLLEAPAQGGRVVSALETQPGESDEDFHNPSALPDGRGVLFVIHRTGDRMDTIALWVSGSERKILLQLPGGDFWKPVYCRSGHVLFHRRDPSRGIWAFPFSLEKLERTGELFRVSETGAFPSVADDGTLAFSLEGLDLFDPRQLVWLDREGNVLNPIGQPLPGLMTPRISPDGRRVVASAGEWWAELDLWLFDASAGGATAFAQSPDQDIDPFWWQEGRTILWTRRLNESWSVSIRSLDGAGEEQSLLDGEAAAASDSGEFLLVRQRSADGTTTLGYVSMRDGPGTIHPLPEFFRFIRNPTLSPDDHWLAYQSPEAGSTEVCLVDFPEFRLARQAVSRGGGRNPLWHPGGNSLFYLTKDGRTLMSAQLKAGGPETGEPTKVFDLPESVYGGFEWFSNFYDVAKDGQRFLMLQRAAVDKDPTSSAKPNLRVVVNWFEDFREMK